MDGRNISIIQAIKHMKSISPLSNYVLDNLNKNMTEEIQRLYFNNQQHSNSRILPEMSYFKKQPPEITFQEQEKQEVNLSSDLEEVVDTFTLNLKGMGFLDYTKDGNEKQIVKGHPLYELSQIIIQFEEGEETEITAPKKMGNVEDYFAKKGPHFCAGYMSKFGLIELFWYKDLFKAALKVK